MIVLFDSISGLFSRMFVSSSKQADDINRLFFFFLILSAVILAIVGFMVIGGVVKYRAAKRLGEPVQITGNKKLELVWTLIPLGIVVVLFFASLHVMESINQPVAKGEKADIVIIAHQWWWDFRYPKEKVITANELHIPVGKKLLMRIESADVIHSWWVPALGRKIDAIPGRSNFGWIDADSVGVYDGTCSEYCGTEHAWMRIKVVAETPADYEKWIDKERQMAATPTDSLGIMGETIFNRKTCGSCHNVSGTPADAHIGPDLTHFASRTTILSGMMPNTQNNLKKWLEDPQKVKEGANMPDFLLSDKEVSALVDYLEKLK